MLIDTHSHLYTDSFDSDRDEAVARALESGVRAIILPGIDQSHHTALMQTAAAYPNFCLPAIGLHPTSVDSNYKQELTSIEKALEAAQSNLSPYIAIGEIGIDGYWSKEYLNQQREAFERQIEWAALYRLPVIIHSRNSFDDLYEILYRRRDLNISGVFHAFSGSYEQFKQLQKCGNFRVGIGGVVTYKNAGLAEAVTKIGLTFLLLETDSPWLTPVPFRGKRNESSYLIYIVQKLSELLHKSFEEVSDITTQNALTLFPQCQLLFSLQNHILETVSILPVDRQGKKPKTTN